MRARPVVAWSSSTRVPDRPGSLARLLALVGEAGANLVDVDHVREGLDLHVRETAVQLVLETRGASTPTTCWRRCAARATRRRWSARPRRARARWRAAGRPPERRIGTRAVARIAVEGERAAVALDDDRPGDGEALAGAAPDVGGKEGIEDALGHVARDAAAGVRDADQHVLAVVAGVDGDRAALAGLADAILDGVRGVDDQVDEDLVHVAAVAQHRGSPKSVVMLVLYL